MVYYNIGIMRSLRSTFYKVDRTREKKYVGSLHMRVASNFDQRESNYHKCEIFDEKCFFLLL
jgi:hypothetical protein